MTSVVCDTEQLSTDICRYKSRPIYLLCIIMIVHLFDCSASLWIPSTRQSAVTPRSNGSASPTPSTGSCVVSPQPARSLVVWARGICSTRRLVALAVPTGSAGPWFRCAGRDKLGDIPSYVHKTPLICQLLVIAARKRVKKSSHQIVGLFSMWMIPVSLVLWRNWSGTHMEHIGSH